MLAPTLLLLTLHASDGGSYGPGSHCGSSALANARSRAMTSGALPPRWMLCAGMVACWSILGAGWIGGWTCCVEQGRYGHYARKPTLLYAMGCDLPYLDWGHSAANFPAWAIEKHGLAYCKRAGELAFKGGGKDSGPRISTPPAFRDILISMAQSAKATK
jgi:hypothetical protein